jgi:hypothetical protein
VAAGARTAMETASSSGAGGATADSQSVRDALGRDRPLGPRRWPSEETVRLA